MVTARRSLPSFLVLALALPAAARAGLEQLAAVHGATTAAEALLAADRLAGEPGAGEMGIDYLRGNLLELLGHPAEAAKAFAMAMQRAPALAPYCRLRLARLQADKHPEMAAGLLAPLVTRSSPPALRHQAAALLHRSLRAGGDCRLLAGLDWPALDAADRRALSVARADCAPSGDPAGPGSRVADLTRLIDEGPADEATWDAAVRLSGLGRAQLTPEVSFVLGRAFQRLRQPELAGSFLGPLVSTFPAQIRDQRHVEAFELLALSQVARDAYRSAVSTFARLAERVARNDQRARARYHEGFARELAGDRVGALHAYVSAANLNANGEWTSAAMLATCRLQWLLVRRADAQRTYDILRARREWSARAAEAATFLAVSQLARGEVGTAPLLLQQAVQLRGATDSETVYWIGRADEAQGDTNAALLQYLRLLREIPYHPLTAEARGRLAGAAMQPAVKTAVERWRRSPRADDRLAAWLLLPAGDPQREPLRLYLYQQWARDRRIAPYLKLAPVDAEEWPLWQSAFDDPEDRVLALGGWREVSGETITKYFPLRQPALAFTAAQRLLAARDPGRALALAQETAAPALAAAPPQLLPLPLREVLFPRPWPQRVEAAAKRVAVEPALLWGVMREGSRFDTTAMSEWGGRGLMLLDPASAERAAGAAGVKGVRPDDLYEPEIAIAVGAARLAQLGGAFNGRQALALAAHLVGTAQAKLWASWCTSGDPAETLAKIGNPDVRTMVERMLGAQMAYRELGTAQR
ncbi:MAG TPA: transglycosylase SLT domain-containing protein [Thermoanaerobaculia bacterium]|jgi:soluble lytic murein transglycosylase-like protein|nr:transglycosylase SLT domain-containing protein [Thermoanaerobaculia bacterium]